MIAAIAVILVGAGTYTEAYCNPLILKSCMGIYTENPYSFCFFIEKTACENFMQNFYTRSAISYNRRSDSSQPRQASVMDLP